MCASTRSPRWLSSTILSVLSPFIWYARHSMRSNRSWLTLTRHGSQGGGFWGVISVMLFAHPNRVPHIADGGVLYAWDRNAFVGLGKNVLGGACIFTWTAFWAFLLFAALHAAGHLRISPEAEEDGQDFIEGEPAYPIDLAVFSE